MADQPNPTDVPYELVYTEPHVVTDDSVVTVRVRRAPKYGVFIVLGAMLGVVTALILTVAVGTPDQPTAGGAVYSQPQVFGFLMLICVAVGVVAGGVVALIIDRVMSRRAQEVRADLERTRLVD